MKLSMLHSNINVVDLEKSMKFYADAFGLFEVGRIAPESGEFIIVYLGDGSSGHKLELTWLRDRTKPYDLGDNTFHLAFGTDDYDGALAKHTKMGCVAFVNEEKRHLLHHRSGRLPAGSSSAGTEMNIPGYKP